MRENVWAWQPWRPVNIRDGRGPERVVHEGPDKPEFTPRPAGFTADIEVMCGCPGFCYRHHRLDTDPLPPGYEAPLPETDAWSNWEGDQA